MLQNIDENIKNIPIFYGYGIEDPYISTSKMNELSSLLKKRVTKKFKNCEVQMFRTRMFR